MKVLEVKNGFVKFLADNTLKLSSFIKIIGLNKCYVAQIFQLNQNLGENIAYAKILFNVNDDKLTNYDKSIPEINSKICLCTNEILNNSLIAHNPIIVGKTLDENKNIIIDSNAFNKKMFVSVDDINSSNLLITNLAKQFKNLNKKTIVIDTLGNLNAKSFVAGKDFKLPLNKDSLEFLYKECLADATADSKSLIMDIFKDLLEYAKSVDFLPFKILKNIVDNMVDKEHIFKLLVLKNKLSKYDKLGYFANNSEEVNNISRIFNLDNAIINLSKLDNLFLNRYLTYIYEIIDNTSDLQIFLTLSNLVDKKSLGRVLKSSQVSSMIITHSKFKYITDMLNIFDNFIIVPSITNNRIFNTYSTFLENMSKNSYLIVGESTNYIPLASKLLNINDVIEHKNTSIKTAPCSENINSNTNNTSDKIQELENLQEIDNSVQHAPTVTDNSESQNPVIENVNDTIEVEQEKAVISQEELIDNIDNYSEEVIAKIAENTEQVIPNNLFEEEIENDNEYTSDNTLTSLQETTLPQNIENNISEVITNENEELSEDNLNLEVSDDEEISEEILIEDEELSEDNLDIKISNDEEILIEDEELSEDNLDIEISNDEEILIENEELSEDNLNLEVSDNEEVTEEILNNNEEFQDDIELEADEIIEISDDLQDDLEQIDMSGSNTHINNDTLVDELSDNNLNDLDEIKEQYTQNPTNIIPIKNDNEDFDNLEEFVELNPDDLNEDDIVVDMLDDDILPDNVDEQVIQDVDKVFTTIKDDDISDSDLDFIEELDNQEELLEIDDVELDEVANNSAPDTLEDLNQLEDSDNTEIQDYVSNQDNEKLVNEEILETKSSSTPLVPVFSAEIPKEDLVVSDPIAQGDYVYHAKCGNGVVEKMIKYGNKTLYSINFDNIGRRLMDPNLTEIKKVR